VPSREAGKDWLVVYDVAFMIHPSCELRYVDASIGYGLFATQFIPKGTITWVFDDLDQIITPARMAGMTPVLLQNIEKYSYLNGRGERILCWDHSRFVNHSCDPTCLAPGFDLEIAVRDIQEGEQITDDYGSLNIEEEFECACGTQQCRRTVGPGDFARLNGHWDALVSVAFALIGSVEQPLWNLVAERAEITKILSGEMQLPSCRVHSLGAASARRQSS
jgi:hypothetical protein